MDNFNLTQANNKYLITSEAKVEPIQLQAQNNPIQFQTQTNPAQFQTLPQEEKNEDGSKKLLGTLAALGAIAAAGVGIALAIKKGKNPVKGLSDINFSKGVAKLDSGKNYSGVIQDTLKNGDKITLQYADGVLKKSTRSGSINFEKVYETLEDGSKVVTKTQGDKVVKTNITDIQNAAKDAQKDLEQLLGRKDELDISDFKKQADAISFKSKKQQGEINDILTHKQAVIDEKIAQEEAQRAAQKAEEEAAKKAQEQIVQVEKPLEIVNPNETLEEAYKNKLNSDSLQELQEAYDELSGQIVTSPFGEVCLSSEQIRNNQAIRKTMSQFDEKIKQLQKQEKYDDVVKRTQQVYEATIKDAATKSSIPVKIQKGITEDFGTYSLSIADDKKVYGLADVCCPKDSAFFPGIPDEYNKSALEIHFLAGSDKSKGAGKELIKQVVRDSIDLGYGGRVKVNACGGSLPPAFSAIAGAEKMKTSPVPFYYKCGFRFGDPTLNKQVEDAIADLNKGLEYTGPMSGSMFLPDDAIQALLNS